MLDQRFIQRATEGLDLEAEKVETPKRLVDFDITTSFAHLNPNLNSDDLFGYAFVDNLLDTLNGDVNAAVWNYDGTLPEKEKPTAFSLETLLKNNERQPQSLPVSIPFFFKRGVPLGLQDLEKDLILARLDQPWERFVKNSGFGKPEYNYVTERVLEIVQAVRDSVGSTNSGRAFLQELRRRFVAMSGINSYGEPESAQIRILAQKLEEDLEAGFPFWRMGLPSKFEAKHKSNEGTYLFWGLSLNKTLVPVRFYTNPDRFEFEIYSGRISVSAEDSPKAMAEGKIIPTSSLLNYIVLSPARKPTTNGRTKRIHIAGPFMAGENGYAKEMIHYLNETPGFDEVRLVYTGYDGSLIVRDKSSSKIGFGSFYPQFGKVGIQRSLKIGDLSSLGRGQVCFEK